MSVNFIGIGGPGQIGDLKKSQPSKATNKNDGVQSKDQVQFSSVLQDVNKANSTSSTQDAERAARVAELKAQIAEGSYQPNLNKVASSLLKFIVEE